MGQPSYRVSKNLAVAAPSADGNDWEQFFPLYKGLSRTTFSQNILKIRSECASAMRSKHQDSVASFLSQI